MASFMYSFILVSWFLRNGSVYTALGFGFAVFGAVVARDHASGLRIVTHTRTLSECARAATSAGKASVDDDAGHAAPLARAAMA